MCDLNSSNFIFNVGKFGWDTGFVLETVFLKPNVCIFLQLHNPTTLEQLGGSVCIWINLSCFLQVEIKMKKPEAVRWEKLEGQGDSPKLKQFTPGLFPNY